MQWLLFQVFGAHTNYILIYNYDYVSYISYATCIVYKRVAMSYSTIYYNSNGDFSQYKRKLILD